MLRARGTFLTSWGDRRGKDTKWNLLRPLTHYETDNPAVFQEWWFDPPNANLLIIANVTEVDVTDGMIIGVDLQINDATEVDTVEHMTLITHNTRITNIGLNVEYVDTTNVFRLTNIGLNVEYAGPRQRRYGQAVGNG
jgi:hypothetical protein